MPVEALTEPSRICVGRLILWAPAVLSTVDPESVTAPSVTFKLDSGLYTATVDPETVTDLPAVNQATVLEAAATVLIVKRATAGKIILDFFIINFFSFKICAITQKKFNMLFFFRSIESMIG